MGIGFGKELAATGVVQLVQQFDDGRRVNLKLFQSHAGDGQSHLEGTSGILHHSNQRVQRRDVGAFGNLIDAVFVGIIIVIIVVVADVEETVTFQMDDLMYLKVKTDCSHFYSFCFRYLP